MRRPNNRVRFGLSPLLHRLGMIVATQPGDERVVPTQMDLATFCEVHETTLSGLLNHRKAGVKYDMVGNIIEAMAAHGFIYKVDFTMDDLIVYSGDPTVRHDEEDEHE